MNEKQTESLEIYKSALRTVESDIANEKFGLVIDGSGQHRPEIVNDEEISRLEARKKDLEAKIAELQETVSQ